jgi:aryl-alcohol dehydrogenase-like predicted oxidoreductase
MIPTMPFGRTGHDSTRIIFGAAALGAVTQDEADATLELVRRHGVNHLDTAASYGDSELRLAPFLAAHRDEYFLATKTEQRTREAAYAEINKSLERLQTDHVDLIQLHAVGDLDELDKVTGPGGALEAAVLAQQQGLATHVGITGHGHAAPSTHLEALRRHPFATVLTPLNAALWQRPDYRADYESLVAEVQRQDVGLMTIKTVSRRNWPAGSEKAFTTWYEPYADAEKIRAGVSWVLSHPELTGLATPGDVRLLRHVVAAERDRMPVAEAEALLVDDETYSSPFESMPF